ncbi:hypothetical protein BKA66DRAFT_516750 [Pyrenochaeta sp. MPI-SDFR-AT-0127]|nr:hypothetical protein BKA66DRAFT_516750 [Pyrenochaeta sp. MPI-SDFR-AT-0127]
MMIVKNTFVPVAVYNGLPHITEVVGVPEMDAANLADLLSIRLIHKHFDINDGEVMAFKEVTAKPFGNVLVMRPVASAAISRFEGLNYFVNDGGELQAYEYINSDTLNLAEFPEFLAEFCALVVERGLQRKLRLKTKSGCDVPSWSEFEYPCHRSTMIILKGMPVPEGDSGFTVATEWGAPALDASTMPDGENSPMMSCFSHCVSHCNGHCTAHDSEIIDGGMWYLGGKKLEAGAPVYNLMAAVVEVWG